MMTISSCKDDELTQNDPLPNAPINFKIEYEAQIPEGQDTSIYQFKVKLSDAARNNISLTVKTEENTALANVDFIPFEEEIEFKAGNTSKTIQITILGNSEVEEDKSFYINFTNPVNAILITDRIEVFILNDDTLAPKDTLPFFVPDTGYYTPISYPNMTLIWNDEFEDTVLNSQFWTYEIGTGNWGWGNNELQYYTDRNTIVKEGYLVIEAKEENIGANKYTSSRIVTMNKFDFVYGRVDIRAALPYGQGIWPALWMLGANFQTAGWPECGETDIMEMVGGGANDSEVHGTCHWSNAGNYATYSGSYILPQGKFYDEFHVFSIYWNSRSITWYVDDIKYHEIDITPAELSEFRNNAFFIFNVAVGGNWPGSPDASTVFPQRMIVDYVRVFQNL